MVRGLIEHKHVWLLQHQLAEKEARGFSARKNAGGFGGFVPGKQHLTEQAANLFADGGGIPLMQPLQRGRAAFDEAAVVLGEISDGGFVSQIILPESTKGPS